MRPKACINCNYLAGTIEALNKEAEQSGDQLKSLAIKNSDMALKNERLEIALKKVSDYNGRLEHEGKWISVADEMPGDDIGKCLVCFGEPFFGETTPEIECGYYDEESESWLFWMNDREIQGSGVTHWKPLPAKPIED